MVVSDHGLKEVKVGGRGPQCQGSLLFYISVQGGHGLHECMNKIGPHNCTKFSETFSGNHGQEEEEKWSGVEDMS